MAKRVNKRFLILLTGGLMVLFLGLFLVVTLAQSGDPVPYITAADQALEQGDFATAKERYLKAIRHDKNNPELFVKLGDAHYGLARAERHELDKAQERWNAALEINPRYVPALQRLMDAMVESAEIAPSTSQFQEVRRRAGALARADDENLRAQAYEHVGLLGMWHYNHPVAEQELEATLAALAELMRKAPNETEIPVWIARTRLRQGVELVRRNDREGARAKGDAAAAVLDEAVKENPGDVGLLLRQHELLRYAYALSPPEGADAGEGQKRLWGILEKAREVARPEDRYYTEARTEWASHLRQMGKPAEAEAELKALLAERPADQKARHAMVEALMGQPERRREMIGLLSQPVQDDPQFKGIQAMVRMHTLNVNRQMLLVRLRLQEYPATPEAERPALRQIIQSEYDQLTRVFTAKNPDVLKLRADLTLLDGSRQSVLEAIGYLQEAQDTHEREQKFDRELMAKLAMAYTSVGQTGQARALLTRIVQRSPNDVQARRMLLGLLLGERLYDQAQEHLQQLEEKLPGDPEVGRLRLQLLAGSGKRDEGKPLVEKLPEETPEQRLYKGSVARVFELEPLALKLLEPLSNEELAGPGARFVATDHLVRLHLEKGRRDEARKLIAAVLQKSPEDPSWKMFQGLADETMTAGTAQELAEHAVEAIKDPASRAIQGYRLRMRQQKPEEGLRLLQEAERETRGDGQVVDMIFRHYLESDDLEQAAVYAKKLEALNWDQAQGLTYRTMLLLARRDAVNAVVAAEELTRRLGHLSGGWVLLGRAQQLSGQHAKAVECFRNALDRQLDNFDAMRGIIDSHVALRQIPQAQRYVEQGMKSSRNPAYFYEISKQLNEQHGDPAKVTAAREKDLEANKEVPGNYAALVDNYIKVGEALMARKDEAAAREYFTKARARLDEAMKKWPDDAAFYARVAEVAWREGEPQRGLEILNQLAAREAWKSRAEPQHMIGLHLLRMGPAHWPKAEEAFKEALAASSNSPAMRRQLASFYIQTGQGAKAIEVLSSLYAETKDPMVRNQLIDLQFNTGKFADAEKLILQALEQSPRDVRLLCALGAVKIQMRDYEAAKARIEEALQISPQDAVALKHRGRMKHLQYDLTGALQDLNQARTIAPDDVEVLLALAEVYLARGQTQEAATELYSALQHAPTRIDLRTRLVHLYMDSKRWPQAERLLNEAKANPELGRNPHWLKLESQMWGSRGEPQKMLASLQQAIQLAPGDEGLQFLMLEALHKTGQQSALLRAANDLIEKPQALRPWWAHMMRGDAYKATGKLREAEADFDAALNQADEVEADHAAEVIARHMASALGHEKAIDKLSGRLKVRWLIELATLHMEQADWKKAAATADQLTGPEYAKLSPPQRLKALLVSGQIYTASATLIPQAGAKAEQAYVRYIEEAGRQQVGLQAELHALNNLACLFADSDAAKALGYSRRAQARMEQTFTFDPNIMDTHGWLLILNDQVDEGVEVLKAVVTRQNHPPDAHYHLGEAMLRKAQPAAAQGHLEKAQAMIGELKSRKEFYDPSLEPRIAGALGRVKTMLSASGGVAP